MVSSFFKNWDIFIVGAAMIGGFAVIVLKLIGVL
jgi:hypothetical protein